MKSQKLDDDGLASSYLLLTMFLPLAIYLLYRCLKKTPTFKCTCTGCAARRGKRNIPRLILGSVVVLIVLILLKNILTIQISNRSDEFDPFKVLGVTAESTAEEIRKGHRKLIKKLNKKFNKTNNKEAIVDGIRDANKAFTILRDPESLQKWMSEDTEKELLIAIPSFILGWSSTFLLFYIAIVTLIVPSFFILKHFAFKKTSTTGSLYESNEMFYEALEGISDVPAVAIHQCIVSIGESVEFTARRWAEPVKNEQIEKLENFYGVPVMKDKTGYRKLLLYLAREIQSQADREFIRVSSLQLIESYKKISREKDRGKVFDVLLVMEKMVNQAVISPEYSLLQYPGVDFNMIKKLIASNENTKANNNLTLKQYLTGERLKLAMNVHAKIPQITISDFRAFTTNTETEHCSPQNNNDQIAKRDDEAFILPAEALPRIQFKLVSDKCFPVCHTPYSPDPVANKWTAYCKLGDQYVCEPVVFDDFAGTKKIEMDLPYRKGRQTVKLFVVSNGYFGNDCTSHLAIKFY